MNELRALLLKYVGYEQLRDSLKIEDLFLERKDGVYRILTIEPEHKPYFQK